MSQLRSASIAAGLLLAAAMPAPQEATVDPTVTLQSPQGQARSIDFVTDEGTWMSVDLSPDGSWIVFDLLGHIYRMPAAGGEAACLTQNSGPALNFHPRISPDGRSIAFVSDRAGQENLWLMGADGLAPRPLSLEPDFRHREPAWTPDGQHILATRHAPTRTGWIGLATEIWKYPAAGGPGTKIAAGRAAMYRWPSITPDGKRVYYSTSMGIGGGVSASHWLYVQSVDLATGTKRFLRDHRLDVDPENTSAAPTRTPPPPGRPTGPPAIPRPGPAEMAPEVSPDGRSVAFAVRMIGATQELRGHRYGPRTALMVRNLETGQERVVMDPITIDLARVHRAYAERVLPGYAWAKDGKSIVIAEGGKIRRVSVDTGKVATIPFQARVKRLLFAQPRSRVVIDDDAVTFRFLQWPASSPDGRTLAFVAGGRIWLVDLPDGPPRALEVDLGGALALTPAWSPDGSRIAFTSWDDLRQGHVWTVARDGREPRQLTKQAGQYLHPAWSPDGKSIVVVRGPGIGPPEEWNGWEREGEWTAVTLPSTGGAETRVVAADHLFRPHFGRDGQIYYAAYLGDRTSLRSVSARGGQPVERLRLPPPGTYLIDVPSDPVLSPDDRWVAYEAARSIYVAPVPAPKEAGGTPFVDTDPNRQIPDRVRIGERGGVYHRWRDSTTLELVSSSRHLVYDAAHGTTAARSITLRVPRPPPGGTIALTHARVITLEGSTVLDDATVLVRGARIACVGQCNTAGADRVLDLRGKVIVPGFVDVHEHTTRQRSPVVPQHWYRSALDLAYGITTILDPASLSTSGFPLAEMTDAGVVLGPRVFSVAENVYGWGDRIRIRTLEDARFEVYRRADWGAISIKNYRLTRREQQQRLLEACRERGITVTGEGGYLEHEVGMAIDGQTGWEHFIPPIPIYRDVSTFFGRAGMVYSPTASTAGHYTGMTYYYRPLQNLLADPKYRRFVPRRRLESEMQIVERRSLEDFSFPFIAEGLADVIRAGGYGAIGDHGEQPGIGSHWEIWSYAQALTPLEALTVASKHGAYFLGLDEQIGSIARGKLADLVILNRDPLVDIRNTADILYVMKGGRLYDDDTLAEVWPERRPYGPLPWR